MAVVAAYPPPSLPPSPPLSLSWRSREPSHVPSPGNSSCGTRVHICALGVNHHQGKWLHNGGHHSLLSVTGDSDHASLNNLTGVQSLYPESLKSKVAEVKKKSYEADSQ